MPSTLVGSGRDHNHLQEHNATPPGDTFSSWNFSRTFWWIGLLAVLIGYGLFQLTSLLYLIVTAIIVALSVERFITFWQRVGCSRNFSIGIAYLILIVFMLSGIMILIPFLIAQFADVIQHIIVGVQGVQTMITEQGRVATIQSSHIPNVLKQWLIANSTDGSWLVLLQETFNTHMSQIVSVGSTSLKSAGSFAVGAVNSVVNTLLQIVLVLTIAVFFSLERKVVVPFVAQWFQKPRATANKIEQLSQKLGLRLEGQLLLCVIIGFLVALGLWILSWIGIDLPNKFSLALIAGLTEFIPYVGPLLGAIPALFVGGLSFGRKGIVGVMIMYRVIQTAENNIIVPAVMAQKLGVSPLVIFLCMLVGASLFGFLGILLAVPLSVIVSIVVGTKNE